MTKIVKSAINGIKNKIAESREKRRLSKIMKDDAKMDILKVKLEAEKQREIYIAKEKEKIKAKRQLEKFQKDIKNKRMNQIRYLKMIILLVFIFLLLYILIRIR